MTDLPDGPGGRRIELEVEVAGTPEEVWRAIATGPGISSWYVPHAFEEHEGADAIASFGEGPEMQVAGVVAVWDPPHRIVFTGPESGVGLAFEWLVEARDGGSCVVRLVNSGFGSGEVWDAQYDAMEGGWRMFLRNLQLHLEHFRGRSGTSMLPMAMWPGDPLAVWPELTGALGLPDAPAVGDRVTASADGPAPLGGAVVDSSLGRLVLVLDAPAPGTAIIAAEGAHGACGVSIWSDLYGDDAAGIVDRDRPLWHAWLVARAPQAQG